MSCNSSHCSWQAGAPWLLAVLLLAGPISVAALLPGGTILPKRPKPNTAVFELNVTLTRGSPDCGRVRNLILINGLFQPTLKAQVNDTIQITLRNKLPPRFPQTGSGISIHWHGLDMWDNATWFDGTPYVTQCPLASGKSVTYSFLANEAPGTYFWHDHSTANRADGLQGAFILTVPPKMDPPIPNPFAYDGEFVMFLSDWFATEGNALAMSLNRPYDLTKATNDTGMYRGVTPPEALLINGKGNSKDCSTQVLTGVKTSSNPPICNVTSFTTKAGGNTTGCTHTQYKVQKGKTYMFRIINSAAMTYMTVCFENHTLELLTADGTPTDYFEMSNGCIDINSGQRYDVAVTMDQDPSHNYWVSVHSQYRSASPSAYAVLRYVGTTGDPALPPSPTPLGTVEPWDDVMTSYVVSHPGILGILDNWEFYEYYQLFQHGGSYGTDVLNYQLAARQVTLNMSNPLLSENGAIRWAVNNIATMDNPPCKPLLSMLHDNKTALDPYMMNTTDRAAQSAATAALMKIHKFNNSSHPAVYDVDEEGPLLFPAAGMQIIRINEPNQVIDVVLNNLNGSSNNGDYRNISRTGSDPHPIHLHGHKFWVLGSGPGIFNYTEDEPSLNLYNPILRDTVTLPPSSWVVIRFTANNPGIWPLHCHILWHSYMGQTVYFMENLDLLPPKPPSSTQAGCPTQCLSNFAPFTQTWVKNNVNTTKFDNPNSLG